MARPDVEIEVPDVVLTAADADEYCRSVLASRRTEMWWWQTGLAPYRGFSRPFQDADGRWWWRIKPQFSWYLDFFSPLSRRPSFPIGRSLLGCQYPVAKPAANSLAHFNVIHDLRGYDVRSIASQKRRAVRKGLRNLQIAPLDLHDGEVINEAREVWNSHVQRTGWSSEFAPNAFAEAFMPLADTAATTALGARTRESGGLCAWLVGRLVQGTAYVDTIASHTERLGERPNDTLIYVFLYNASRTDGIRHANYFLRSSLEPLEKFKQSLGFDSSGIPSRVHVNPVVGLPMRLVKPSVWRRLHGDWHGPITKGRAGDG